MKLFKKISVGFALIASVLFLQVGPALAQGNVQQDINSGLCAGSELQFTDSSTANCKNDEATEEINKIIRTIVNLLSAVVGIVAVIMIIFGGLRYITSGGNDTSITGAKNTILYAIIGLIVVALAQILVRFTISKVTNT